MIRRQKMSEWKNVLPVNDELMEKKYHGCGQACALIRMEADGPVLLDFEYGDEAEMMDDEKPAFAAERTGGGQEFVIWGILSCGEFCIL